MIVLFNPWSTPSPKKPLPMSLLAVGSMLEGEFDYTIVDGNLEADPVGRFLEIERATRVTAVAVTVMPGPQLRAAVNACRQLKRLLPGVPIVWGGYFPSQHARTVLQDGAVDYCVHSQGEHTFLELTRVLARGRRCHRGGQAAGRRGRDRRRSSGRTTHRYPGCCRD